MKRIITFAFAAALLVQAVFAIAQDSPAQAPGEPSEQSALGAAREKYWSKREAEAKPAQEAPEAATAPESSVAGPEGAPSGAAERAAVGAKARDNSAPYTPIQLSVVPGLTFPRGRYDTSLAAGMFGSRSRDVSGIQGSGAFSLARNVHGAQGAGAFNVAREVHGVQGAGLFNVAREIRGSQFSGLFNVAGEVEGAQFGLVNFARRVDGVQVGLLNFAKNGVHSLGFAYEPKSSYAYAYWQSGMPALYTRWSLGARCRDWELDSDGVVASLGLGTRRSIYSLDVDMDLSAECEIGDNAFDRVRIRHEKGGCEWEGDLAFPRPYPSLRIEASLPVGSHWRIFGGLKADVDANCLGDRVPEGLKVGGSWKGRLWGEDYAVWPKCFFGLKI
jgi:hypothetical protein